MTFNDKKQIILSYMEADIKGTIPDRPAFIPGLGRSPNVKAHADDTFRLLVNAMKDKNSKLTLSLLEQLSIFVNQLK